MLYKNKQYESTYLPNYSEPMALQTLLVALNVAMGGDIERMEHEQNYTGDQFVIIVGGKAIAFILGAPQVEGLYKFVQSIADENFYAVDFHRSEVD